MGMNTTLHPQHINATVRQLHLWNMMTVDEETRTLQNLQESAVPDFLHQISEVHDPDILAGNADCAIMCQADRHLKPDFILPII